MVLSVVAIGVSGAAVIVTVLAWRSNRRATEEARRAATAADQRARSVERALAAMQAAQDQGDQAQAPGQPASWGQAAEDRPAGDRTTLAQAGAGRPAATAATGSGRNGRPDGVGQSGPEDPAGQVRLVLSSHDGLTASVSNRSSSEIHDVNIDTIRSCENPRYRWRPSPHAVGNSPHWDVLAPGDEVHCVVEFVTEHGYVLRVAGSTYESVLSFTDANGQRWVSDGNGSARPVDA